MGSGPGHFAKLLETETTQKVVMLDSSSASLLFSVPVQKTQECIEGLLYRDPDEEFEGIPILLICSRLSIQSQIFSPSRKDRCRRREPSGYSTQKLTGSCRFVSKPPLGQ